MPYLCRWFASAERDARSYAGHHPGWVVLRERCRVCGHESIGVAPLGVDRNRLQCAGCGEMTARGKVVR